ncbi:MAG: hypothetical protein AAFU85_06900 [Planctomycetota bacterium]
MRPPRRGVTFLEITLVVLFIGILAAVGAPYFATATRVQNTRNAAIQLADYIGYVRRVAINEGRSTSIVIDPATDTFSSPDVDFPDQIGNRISVPIKANHDPGLELSASFDSSLTLQFDLEGSPFANGTALVSGWVTIRSADASQRIVIDAGTGTTTFTNDTVLVTDPPPLNDADAGTVE